MNKELERLIYISKNYQEIPKTAALISELDKKFKNKRNLETDSFLADIFRKYEEYELAEYYSRRTLVNLDKYSIDKNRGLKLYEKKITGSIFSYSLFGVKKEYYIPLVESINNIKMFLPEYKIVVYIDETVNKNFVNFLNDNLIEIKEEKKSIDLEGTFWRFNAIDDYKNYWIHFRDSDSIITKREIKIIKYLEKYQYDYLIRDSISHCHPMLAGLFGISSKPNESVRELIFEYQNKRIRGADQFFLAEYFWSWYKINAIHLNRFHFNLFNNQRTINPDKIDQLKDQRLHMGSKIADKMDINYWLNLRFNYLILNNKNILKKISTELK